MDTNIEYETKRLDHLGIVAGICHEIELVSLIDDTLPTPSGRKVSCGTATLAMILNGLGFTGRALYLMPEYMENKAVEVLIRGDLEARDFNDDTLGRALDELFQVGITELFASIAKAAIEKYQLDVEFAHTDTSSFSLSGEYESEVAKEAEEVREAVKIRRGYSKDHRPDLKQVVVTLITSQKGRIPLWLEALDGNSSDKTSFPESVNAYCKHLKAETEAPYFVMDSAAYTAENVGNWGSKKKWITRVPETIGEAKRALESIETEAMNDLSKGYAIFATTSEYGGVRQRWLIVHSAQAEKREAKELNKQVARATVAVEKSIKKLKNQLFSCKEDAVKSVAKLAKKLKWHTVEATYEPIKKYEQRGRPARGIEPQVIGWQVTLTHHLNSEKVVEQQKWLGRFLLATNELDEERLTAEKILNSYKAQGATVERGFRFLKDPLFFADSLFLKSPARIMAMIMIMGLCLLIYALAEWQVRQQLKNLNQSIPDQKGKPTQRPTMRRIAQMFEGIDLLVIRQGSRIIERRVLNLTPVRLQLIRLFSPTILNCYLLDF